MFPVDVAVDNGGGGVIEVIGVAGGTAVTCGVVIGGGVFTTGFTAATGSCFTAPYPGTPVAVGGALAKGAVTGGGVGTVGTFRCGGAANKSSMNAEALLAVAEGALLGDGRVGRFEAVRASKSARNLFPSSQ